MEPVLVDRQGRVATVTLNRPERLNAIDTPLVEGLLSTLDLLAADRSVGAVVVTGAGRGFCAGGDVQALAGDYFQSLSLSK